MSRRFTPRPALRALAIAPLFVAACFGFAGSARAAAPTSTELAEIGDIARDPARAGEAVPKLRTWIKDDPDTSHRVFLNQMLLWALLSSQAPVPEIISQSDKVEALGFADPLHRMSLYVRLANEFIGRGAFKPASGYAQRLIDEYPQGQGHEHGVGVGKGLLGRARLGLGDTNGAITLLNEAIAVVPDSQSVLVHLGRAYTIRGRSQDAINAYVRSLGAIPSTDTSAAAPLRELYRKKKGSLVEMEQRIEQARNASKRRYAIDSRRFEAPAAEWELPDTAGRTIQSSQFKGKVVVLDFWGSWCGPCRAELPHFQSVFERYKERDEVAFVGINWEREQTSEQRKQVAKQFILSNRFGFTNVLDLEHKVADAFGIEGFPTAYVIDREGVIRFRNVGFNEHISEILVMQIESLLD